MSPQHTYKPFVQESLLSIEQVDDIKHVVISDTNEMVYDAPLSEEAAVVNLPARAGHLALALDHVATVNKLGGFEAAQHLSIVPPQISKYGSALPELTKGVHFKLGSELQSAQREFRAAYEAGMGAVADDDEDFLSAYNQFMASYAGTANRDARDNARQRFKKLARIQGEQHATVYNTASDDEIAATTPKSEQALTTLTTLGKLEALRDDARAGFLPTTNNEKNEAVALLDYLDPQKYPYGINQRLAEIYGRQMKVAKGKGMNPHERQDFARQAVYSVINEYADYAHNAHESGLHLGMLASIVDDTDYPNITLAALLREQPELAGAVAEVVRYQDLIDLRAGRLEQLPFRPLETVTNREIHTDTKHKQIEDKYTATRRLPEVTEHINAVAGQLKIKFLRTIVENAMQDQRRREAFWTDILERIRYEYRDTAQTALRSAIQ